MNKGECLYVNEKTTLKYKENNKIRFQPVSTFSGELMSQLKGDNFELYVISDHSMCCNLSVLWLAW